MVFGQYSPFMDTGTGLLQRFGCEAREDVFNPAGLRSPLVDEIINIAADGSRPAERDVALMALDRVLRWERFMIPVWYNRTTGSPTGTSSTTPRICPNSPSARSTSGGSMPTGIRNCAPRAPCGNR
jgi:hypothetical protein